jgi:hypothetical protein
MCLKTMSYKPDLPPVEIEMVSFLRQSFTEFKAETASAFLEQWMKEGEQDARLNTVERKHEGLKREHNVLTREHRVHHNGEII